jgi:uncharacterized protein YjbJ (UPF0337 family)
MADRDSGPKEGVKGVVEDVEGLALRHRAKSWDTVKEALGTITGNDRLEREGQAQQDKGASQREVAQREAQAERARAEAEMHEARERSEQ